MTIPTINPRAWFRALLPHRLVDDPAVSVAVLSTGTFRLGIDIPRGVRVTYETLPAANASDMRMSLHLRADQVAAIAAILREASDRLVEKGGGR